MSAPPHRPPRPTWRLGPPQCTPECSLGRSGASRGACEPAPGHHQPENFRGFDRQALLRPRGRLPIHHGRFPFNHGRFPINHGRLPISHGHFPIKHGRLPIHQVMSGGEPVPAVLTPEDMAEMASHAETAAYLRAPAAPPPRV